MARAFLKSWGRLQPISTLPQRRGKSRRTVTGEESTDQQRATMPYTLLTVSHHMARVTLHYPPANVLTHAVLQELEQVFAELEADEYVRVVVLRGSDRFFSA